MLNFWHDNHKINNNNTLRNFIFIGTPFGISDEEHTNLSS
jgi:hypothetical protein